MYAVEIEYGSGVEYDGGFDLKLYRAVGRPSDYSCSGDGREHGWVCDNEFEVAQVKRALAPFGLAPRVIETTHPKVFKPMPTGEPVAVNLPDLTSTT